MEIGIFGSKALTHFTNAIVQGFELNGIQTFKDSKRQLNLIQIHGADTSFLEDEKIIFESIKFENKVYLIHRPDELLLRSSLKKFFETNQNSRFIFLGDLTFRYEFWMNRKEQSKVIPHPFLDISMPQYGSKWIVGAYTNWGDMRDTNHYFKLCDELKSDSRFQFQIGGFGFEARQVPSFIELKNDFFVPHFNVQLYNLFGKKRLCESSGSLHRGISIPVIFEANGAERLEGLKVIKIEADDDLSRIQYWSAAKRIQEMDNSEIQNDLDHNLASARQNSIQIFAEAAMLFLTQRILLK